MTEEDKSRIYIEKIEEINNYFNKEIDQNKLMSNKNKSICTTLYYIEHFLNLGFVSLYFHFCFCFLNPYFYGN